MPFLSRYMLSHLALFEQFDVASKLVSSIITSISANPRMKDKARDLKEQIVKQVKMKNAVK